MYLKSFIKKRNQKELFYLDRLISLLGTNIYNFILSLAVLKISNSITPFVITLLIAIIPKIFFSTIAGIIVDSFNRKRILILSDFINFIILIILYIYLEFIGVNLYFIYFCTFLINSVSVFFETAITASITNIFEDEQISNVLSGNEIISSISNVISPILGGMLFGLFDFKYFVFFNAISFFISSLISRVLRLKNNCNKSKNLSIFHNIKSVNKFIYGNKLILTLYSSAIFINIFFSIGVTVSTPYIINTILKLSSFQYGIINSMLMIGMIIASFVINKISEPRKKYKFIICGFLFEAISIALLSFPNFIKFNSNIYFIIYSAIFFVLGFFVAIVNIYVRTIMQRIVPDDKKGKVFGTLGTFCTAITPIAMIISAIYIEKYNPFILSLISGMLFLGLTIANMFNKYLKEI